MNKITQRSKIAELIIFVLAEKISIEQALKIFPHEIEDDTTECAFHALLHFDADDEFRKHNPEYAEEQINYLEDLANILKKGDSIPANIISEYKDYYKTAPKKSKKGIIALIKNLFRLTI